MTNTLILGPPGTGKTTTLLNIVDEEFKAGVLPQNISYTSFTRKGAYEARDRAIIKFGFKERDFPFFRTFHSIAFRLIGASRSNMIQKGHFIELGKLLGLNFIANSSMEELPGTVDSGDRFLFLYNYARNTCQDLRTVWNKYGENSNWFRLEQVVETYELYKKKKYLKDFTDLILQFIEEEIILPVDIGIIDEAQDLSSLQWSMVDVAFRNTEKLYIAGDDDQAIYKWSGADVDHFLKFKGKIQILEKSHRLPAEIYELAKTISSRITKRFNKNFEPKDRSGSITYHNYLDSVKLYKGEWLLIARNRYMLKKLEELCQLQGRIYSTRRGSSVDPEHCTAIYTWERLRSDKIVHRDDVIATLQFTVNKLKAYTHGNIVEQPMIQKTDLNLPKDLPPWYEVLAKIPPSKIEYYRSILRNGGNLAGKPDIRIDSIHGVKGGESDNVLLLTDMSNKTYLNYCIDADDEHRVFYVGITRAKNHLHIVMPQTSTGYII
jgi:superfamily I DNA/RNA helicase